MEGSLDTARTPGTLFVVATPIGNLEDITLRALRILREVSLVAAEDTRRTGNLLRHYEIRTPLRSLHEYNERQRTAGIIERLRRGESVALVSDAGTPGISDPGAPLVRAVREAGLRVEPIPGPSAVTALLSAAGLEFDRFAFGGFPPIRSKDRKKWVSWVASQHDIPVVCFEAPHRLRRTLDDFGSYFGKRPIICARELTKIFETWDEGSADELKNRLAEERGEFVLVIGPAAGPPSYPPDVSDASIADVFGRLTEINAGSRRDAIRQTARELGLPTKHVFDALERHKLSGK
jgi:16S rRNA (cytidine1402-2'-O)-methyltransferase